MERTSEDAGGYNEDVVSPTRLICLLKFWVVVSARRTNESFPLAQRISLTSGFVRHWSELRSPLKLNTLLRPFTSHHS